MCPTFESEERPEQSRPSEMTSDPDAASQLLVKELLRLVDHSVWANRLWINHVYSQPDFEEHPRRLLAHIVLGERVWFERISGEQKIRDTFPALEKRELLQRLDENQRTYLNLIPAQLNDVVDFKRASGEEYHARVGDIVLHLLTHGYHHRGQLAAHYAGQKIGYPSTDHIDFLIQNRL